MVSLSITHYRENNSIFHIHCYHEELQAFESSYVDKGDYINTCEEKASSVSRMSKRKLFTALILCACVWTVACQEILKIDKTDYSLTVTLQAQTFQLSVKQGTVEKLKGEIGVLQSKGYVKCPNIDNCLAFGDGTRLHINTHIDKGFTIYWTSSDGLNIDYEDCFELGDFHWYGGPERFVQEWPIEKINLSNFANVAQEDQWGAVIEPYWLNSEGAYIFVDEKVPLFINQNTNTTKDKVCFSAKSEFPYPGRSRTVLHYTIAVLDNAREGHLHAVQNFLGKPTGHPNYHIIERPIWSTWARYKRDVDDQVLLEFAQEIVDNGYPDGQFEIDDNWEDCYGALTFTSKNFSDINTTVQKIKAMNFTVTLWAHPFVNLDCTTYLDIGRTYGYFVQNATGSDLTHWWNSEKYSATYLDFTKAEVREWFIERLKKLQDDHGIDSFKFDAGETTWAPQISVLQGDVESQPNNIVVDYVRTCASFGDLVEVRAGWRTQDLPVFVRMIDKDSHWEHNNGLYTLITTLLQMNFNGYTLVLPDMVGGNGYNGAPSAELFIRWLQANTFMPAIQFSYVPWDYDDTDINVVDISRKFVDLHQKYAPYIQKQMEISIEKGYPVNAPIWWVAPTDKTAQAMDTEYLLGEDILVAPVILEGDRARDIYLPEGIWIDGNDGSVHEGPKSISNYNAPIDVLPYFVRQGSEADFSSTDGASTLILHLGVLVAVILVSINNFA